jgi:hypothetical protein
MTFPRENEPTPIPEPDVVRPPTPPEMPEPNVPSGLPKPGEDIIVPPGPDVTSPPRPQEIPAKRPDSKGAVAMPNDRGEAAGEELSKGERASLSDLRKASEDLKTKIAEAKRRNDMPLDSALGNPEWERKAADGHLDVPDEDGDE